MSDITTLGKGAIPDAPDDRDYKLEDALGAIPPVDFSTGLRLPIPPDTDQAQADCCVGEAWSSYHWQLKAKRFSVRSVFAYIAQSGGGASIRDGGLREIKFGQETFEEMPDPSPKTPQNMRDRKGLNDLLAADDREFDSFVLKRSTIDGVAWGVKNYKGVVFGVIGTNEGWQDMVNPKPPTGIVPIDFGSRPELWGHALYAMGYHLHDGHKCIIAKSSWCDSGAKEHHIKENYFTSGYTFNAWTLIPRKELMTNVKLVEIVKADGTKELGFYLPATAEATLIDKALNFDYPLSTVNNGANVDWPNVKPDYTFTINS